MQVKRRLSHDDGDVSEHHHGGRYLEHNGASGSRRRHHQPPHKRVRVCPQDSVASRPPSRDIISSLPAELLVRILSYLSESTLLEISPVSRLFHRVTSDRQLWRLHYYRRFILPRAHLIPGFRRGAASKGPVYGGRLSRPESSDHAGDYVDWKQSYKLLHNWAGGRCGVEELQIHPRERMSIGKTLVKVVEGLAITADASSGLLVWDLRTRSPIVQTSLDPDAGRYDTRPTCLAVDDELLAQGEVGVAIGFADGAFRVWRMDLVKRQMVNLSRHDRVPYGSLEAVAYCQPYLLAASASGHITLWSLEHPQRPAADAEGKSKDEDEPPAPCMLRSLKSHSTRPPLTLSMRRVSASVIASIAYTLDTVSGWCIGIQDLDIRPSPAGGLPQIVDSRVAHTTPTLSCGSAVMPSGPAPAGHDRHHPLEDEDDEDEEDAVPVRSHTNSPIRLCYSHPYLLATMPDNTLLLYLCTTTSTTLTISPGIRLWGHTSGISDAEITTRGKAVSVSARGDEIRVWELEGRMGGCSVEVRPRQAEVDDEDSESSRTMGPRASLPVGPTASVPEGVKKNKVGFDDEMVIVLKEAQDGRESLLVYDFT